jgi:APA family basic amino acid/polyamine antiporter
LATLFELLFCLFVAPPGGFLPLKVVGQMTSIGTLFAFVIVCGSVLVMAGDLSRLQQQS